MMITLTGFMGSGKTTVGKVLADFLGCPFMDLDDLIVKKAGKSIPEIFAQDGEPAFRQLEARLLRQTVEKYTENTVVLALGGGAVTTPATCTVDGVRTYTCSVCGTTREETLPATGHVWKLTEVLPLSSAVPTACTRSEDRLSKSGSSMPVISRKRRLSRS